MMNSSGGDPEGRRIAGRRAAQLAEAGRVLRVLDVLLQRASFDTSVCQQLAGRIATQELTEQQRAYGRIEPRSRFKPLSSHPGLEQRELSLIFIDECGTSQYQSYPSQSVFALAGVAMVAADMATYCEHADQIKMEFFGEREITFHEPHMRHRVHPFSFRGDVRRQAEFDAVIDELVASTPFTSFGVVVRKTAFADDFIATGLDPYLPTDIYSVAIIMLLERYIDFLAMSPVRRMGRVTFESQGPREDAIHQLEYARTLVDGTQWVPESAFRNWLEPGVRFQPKSGSNPSELADMFSRDLYEWVASGCTKSPRRWGIFNHKIYCRGDGQMGKFGVKVFPDSDLRELVGAHRVSVRSNREG